MPDISVMLYVRHPEPWLAEMTRAWIRIAEKNTATPFELVVVEGGSSELTDWKIPDKFLHYPDGLGIAPEINKGLDACSGKYRVMVGNDVFVRPHWLEMLIEPFERFGDCGASTLANSDGRYEASPNIVEGLWGPLMMFGPEWRVDERFEYCFIDGDLAMRMYESGLRCYRNHNQVVQHGNQATGRILHGREKTEAMLARDKQRFIDKHQGIGSHLWIYHALVNGWPF